MNKDFAQKFTISDRDELYKYFCEYRYQPTTILWLEKIKLTGELDRVKGDINLYLTGVVLLLSMYATVLSFGSVGIKEWVQVIYLKIKFISIGFWCGISFLGLMPIYFYWKSEDKMRRIGIIEYILMCRGKLY